MKKFLINILIIFLLLLGVCSLFQALISSRIRNKTINGKDNFHVINNQHNDVVFLGSSRCTEHFDPGFFKDSLGLKTANLGVNGHGDITMDLIRLKYYLKHNPPPRIAMVNFDPISTYGPFDISKNENLIQKHFFARYAFAAKDEDMMIVDYFHFNYAERFMPLFALLRYRAIIECIDMKAGKSWEKIGYEPQATVWDTITHPIDHNYFNNCYAGYLRNADSIKVHMAYLNAFCKSKNIQLVCVQSPVFKDIYNEKAYAEIGDICSVLNIPFININDDSITSNSKNFTDATHLNTTGVPKMLNVIAKNRTFLSLAGNRSHL